MKSSQYKRFRSIRYLSSGGSRISRWGGTNPLRGADLRSVPFSAKMYVKTKELGPVGGGGGRTNNMTIIEIVISAHYLPDLGRIRELIEYRQN